MDAQTQMAATAADAALIAVPPFARVEQALGDLKEQIGTDAFDDLVCSGIEAAGGVVLFRMKLGEGDASRFSAAIALEGDEAREIAILTIDAGDMRLEPAAASEQPIAALASSYAGLAEHWSRAA